MLRSRRPASSDAIRPTRCPDRTHHRSQNVAEDAPKPRLGRRLQRRRLPIAAGLFAPLGIVLRPEIGAISMSGSSLLVAVNALLLRRIRLPQAPQRQVADPISSQRTAGPRTLVGSLITAESVATALYRCSPTLNTFMRGSVKHQPKPLEGISRNCVKHQPNTFCRASAELAQESGADGRFEPAARCLQIRQQLNSAEIFAFHVFVTRPLSAVKSIGLATKLATVNRAKSARYGHSPVHL
jgi:hypothetical protein